MCEFERFVCLDSFARESSEVAYNGTSNWFISFSSIAVLYETHQSYLLMSAVVLACGFLSFIHVKANSKTHQNIYCGLLVASLLQELFSSKYWHAQSTIMLFRKKIPFHVLYLQPTISYLSLLCCNQFEMGILTEACWMSVLNSLLIVPYMLVSTRFLHLTYHDSHPTYADKLFSVPWTEIIKKVLLAPCFTATFHAISKIHFKKNVFGKFDRWNTKWNGQCLQPLIGLASALAAIFFVSIYSSFIHYILHDYWNVRMACWGFFIFSSCMAASAFVRLQSDDGKEIKARNLLLTIILSYSIMLMVIVVFLNPESEISIGLHEKTGDCSSVVKYWSVGKTKSGPKYLCGNEVAEREGHIYNFNCVPNGYPCPGSSWYTICGSRFVNRLEMAVVVFSCLSLAIAFFVRITSQKPSSSSSSSRAGSITSSVRSGSR